MSPSASLFHMRQLESNGLQLTRLKALGSKCVRVRGQSFEAIFDNSFSMVPGEVDVESRQPMLTCRTCDVERLQIRKGDLIEGLEKAYQVDHHEPDGTGMSVLMLRLS